MGDELTNQSQETTQETNQETNTETQNTASTTETTQSTEQSTEQNQNTEQTQVPQTLKIKFNHEEKEIPYEEATKLIQKGMNYDKVHERYNELASNPGLQYLNKIAEANGVTVEAIVEYWQEEEKQAQIAELAKNNIPADVANELLEARQEKAIKAQKQAQKQAQGKMFKELIDHYPDLKPEDVSQEVWEDVIQNGRTLLSAYSKHENKLLKEENAKLKQGIDVKNKNQENANLSTGSATGNAAVGTDFISKETFEQKKKDTDWMKKNLSKVTQSKWYTDIYGKPGR